MVGLPFRLDFFLSFLFPGFVLGQGFVNEFRRVEYIAISVTSFIRRGFSSSTVDRSSFQYALLIPKKGCVLGGNQLPERAGGNKHKLGNMSDF